MKTPRLDEREFGQFIRHQLNAGLTQLDKPVTERLHGARQIALTHVITPQRSLVSTGRHTLTWCEDNLRPVLLALALIISIACGNYVMSTQRTDDIEDIDSALLSDDLPIGAYLDKGFHSWLADTSSQR